MPPISPAEAPPDPLLVTAVPPDAPELSPTLARALLRLVQRAAAANTDTPDEGDATPLAS